MVIDSSNNCHPISSFFKTNLDQEVVPVQVTPVHMVRANPSIKVDLDRVDHKWVQVQADQWDMDPAHK